MEMLHHLARLFEYDHWANREALASLRRARHCPARSRGVFAHLLAAERIWLARVCGEPAPVAIWPERSLEECERELAELRSLWAEYLAGLTPARLEESVSYANSRGEPYSSTVGDVLTHVIFHSAYHRGQVATDLRASGNVPAPTDFIHAARQGLLEE